jgi:Zn-dependent peptidase ImmA (M78 family)
MQIGERLRIARGAIGYTLEKVAAETGIGQSSLCEFEKDKREPRFSQLSRLAGLYRRSIEFFLSEECVVQDVMLWRDPPSQEAEVRQTEAEFRQLCEQYHRLELLTSESKREDLPLAQGTQETFTFRESGRLASDFQERFLKSEIPSALLRQVLEERFRVKIFHVPFAGSALSTLSEKFGPAILLNNSSKLWRRNFDLAHELFHLLTWHIFRNTPEGPQAPTEQEEKLANAFAARLLLPTDAAKNRIEDRAKAGGRISLSTLDEIAREFGVSLEALLWRLLYLYNKRVEEIQGYIEESAKIRPALPPRQSDQPDTLPERYCRLAIRALNEGKLSLIQFGKYMGLSYKEAQGYLVDEDEGDLENEEISIPAA